MKVYLAGPITGLDYKGCTDWREEAIAKLSPVKGMSPMRGKDYLANLAEMPHKSDELAAIGHVMSTSRGIMTRDRYDCTKCDVLLVNFLGAKKVSIGTVMEVAWADANRIPIVCIMEPGNIHEHGMVDEAIGFRVGSLDEAIRITRIILLGPDA